MSPISAIAGQSQVVAALERASMRTGVDFDYLLRTAKRESGLESQAKATTSSAAGLFQFIEQTWLQTVKKYGSEFGLDRYADAIDAGANGRHKVSDPALRQEILALRHDPEASSLMAGALTRESEAALEAALGRPASKGELYAAHFLGAGGAARLIEALGEAPGGQAAKLFPRAAAANKAIFYDDAGTPRTVAQVYDVLTVQHGSGAETGVAARAAVAPLPSGSLPKYTGSFPAFTAFGRNALMLSAPVIELLASFDPLKDLRGGYREAFD